MDNANIVVGLIVLIVVILVVYFGFLRKKSPPVLEEPAAPEKLPAKPTEQVPTKAVDKAAGKKPDLAKSEAAKPAEKKPAAKIDAEQKPVAEKAVPEKAKVLSEKPSAQELAVDEAKPGAKPSDKPPAQPPSKKPSERPQAEVAKKPTDKPVIAPPREAVRKRDVEGLRKGLTKVREKEGFFGKLVALFTGKKTIDPEIVQQIEEVLLAADVGVKTTELMLNEIKAALDKNELADTDRVWEALRTHAAKILRAGGSGGISVSVRPTVVMVVGVNGVGKTTTIGKLATQMKSEGKTVVLAAGDTFRAAAVQQLSVWGKRIGCEVVRGKDGANPGSVIFDAIQKAKEIGADVVLADTAGRLHTKANLMDELKRVAKSMTKAIEGAPHETLLVLDATNGQNALQQAALFKEALPLSGIVLTKLDGTAKGGVILGICAEHGLSVRYIGIGERAEDLREFDADEFVEAMLGQQTDAEAAA